MAIFTPGPLITDIRGSVGGVTFSANKAGMHAKSLAVPTDPLTPKQSIQRGYLSYMGALWRTLTSIQQAAWDALAASPPEIDSNSLGEQYYLSGFGWFCRICVRRLRTGQSQVLTCPANAPVSPPTTFTLDLYPANGDADRCVINYTSGEFATHYAIMDLSLAPGQGSNTRTSHYVMTWEALGEYATYSQAGLRYHDNFGVTQISQRFFARLYRQHADGIRSTPLELYEDVVPYP